MKFWFVKINLFFSSLQKLVNVKTFKIWFSVSIVLDIPSLEKKWLWLVFVILFPVMWLHLIYETVNLCDLKYFLVYFNSNLFCSKPLIYKLSLNILVVVWPRILNPDTSICTRWYIILQSLLSTLLLLS